jgi:hypothetical protein
VFGEISPSGQTRRRWVRKLLVKMGLAKRAQNVNKDYVSILAHYNCSHGWQLIGCHSLSPLQFQLEPLALEPSVGNQECASSSWRILILQDLLVVSSQCRWRARATRLRQPQKDLWHRCLDIDSVVEFRDFRWKCSCWIKNVILEKTEVLFAMENNLYL